LALPGTGVHFPFEEHAFLEVQGKRSVQHPQGPSPMTTVHAVDPWYPGYLVPRRPLLSKIHECSGYTEVSPVLWMLDSFSYNTAQFLLTTCRLSRNLKFSLYHFKEVHSL
jgi:hypothetical protein